jgi:glycosyltransferase involved in cell wall biosynthesis
MKVLCLSHSYGSNGAARMLASVARHWIDSLGWTVHAAIKPDWSDAQIAPIRAAGMIPVDGSRVTPEYDLALVNTLLDALAVKALAEHMPVVLWAHEGNSIPDTTTLTPGMWKRIFSRPRLIVFQSNWQADTVYRSFIHHLPEERIAVIPNGVPPFYPPPGADPCPAGTVPRIICVGEVGKRKAQLDLVQAVLQVGRRHPLQCSLIGDLPVRGELASKLEALAGEHPEQIHLAGPHPRAATLAQIARADIFSLPSNDESHALAPLEAALLGVPVILADLASHRAIGWQHGHNCLMHRPGDIDQLAACIEAVLHDKDLRMRLQAEARQFARRFDFDTFVNEFTRRLLALVPDGANADHDR